MLARAILIVCVTAFATGASAFEGEYSSAALGLTRSVKIKSNGPGTYRVDLKVNARSCVGELEAYGEIERGNLVVTPPTQEDPPCIVTISRRGSGIAVRERRCLGYHGAGCDFVGMLNKE